MSTPITFVSEEGNLRAGAASAWPLESKSRDSTGILDELDFHASGLMVRVQGVWTNGDLAQFRHFLKLRQLVPTDDELMRSLHQAKRAYLHGDHHLFLCGASPCCKGCRFDTSELSLAAASRTAGLSISTTGCQGRCKHAPVSSLRIGDRHRMFSQVANHDDWRAVLTFAKAAVRADSLLVDPGEAEPFLHDPVHDHGKLGARLEALRFLLGRFRGEGHCQANGYSFQKEVVGSFEAGGRFIALRMAASYPLADGRKDTHRALVIVGPKPAAGSFMGQAYTDGGSTRKYEVEQREQSLLFADALPDHTRRWKRSRKILLPLEEGFEERLEVDAGDGFVTFYTIFMRKLDSPGWPATV